MKFAVMQQVFIQSDVLNLGAPVGETGYIVNIDRRIDQGLSFCVRVPSQQKWYWMPECDLEDAASRDAEEADEIIKESIINHALDMKDENAFKIAVQGRWR